MNQLRSALTLLTLTFTLTACAIAPGMQMDEDSVQSRARKVEVRKEGAPGSGNRVSYVTSPDVGVIPITAMLIAEQTKSQVAAREAKKPAVDPLKNQEKSYQYRVHPFDVLSVTVWDHPELTIPAGEFRSADATGHPVSADGTMFYPHVGVIAVGGKTLPEIRQDLTKKLAKVIQNPQLDAKVALFRSQKIQVTGEVVAPSTLPITDVPMKALDAITQAKGFTAEADLEEVRLTRNGEIHLLDILAVNEQGDVSQNWLLQDGDVLYVPDRREKRVFVLGEVKKPMARPMVRGRLTLADAIGDAEGVDPIAGNPGRIYVIRGSFDRPSIYRLDASSPDALLLAVQFQLRAKDVVYVSTYEVTRWNRVIGQILPTIQLLWQTFDLTNRTFR